MTINKNSKMYFFLGFDFYIKKIKFYQINLNKISKNNKSNKSKKIY